MPRLWLICLCSHVIKSGKSFSQPTFNSSHLIIFKRLFGHRALIISFPALHCMCHVSLPHLFTFLSSSPFSGFEYGNDVWANRWVTFCCAEEPFHQLLLTGHPVLASLAFVFVSFFSPSTYLVDGLDVRQRHWWITPNLRQLTHLQVNYKTRTTITKHVQQLQRPFETLNGHFKTTWVK